MKKIIILFAIALIFNACSNSQEALKVKNSNFNIPLSSSTSELLAYVNSIRAKGSSCAPSAPPLYKNSNLESAAIAHTKDMAINHFLRHDGSGTELDVAKPKNAVSSNFVDRITYFGYPVKTNLLVGENITFTKFSNVKSEDLSKNFKKAVDNWLHDPKHCKILMNPRFTYAGIGYQKAKDRYYFTIDFAERNTQK